MIRSWSLRVACENGCFRSKNQRLALAWAHRAWPLESRKLKEPNAATWSAKAFKGMGAFECHRATRGLADVRDNMAAFNGYLRTKSAKGDWQAGR
jgi:hypothetical protein